MKNNDYEIDGDVKKHRKQEMTDLQKYVRDKNRKNKKLIGCGTIVIISPLLVLAIICLYFSAETFFTMNKDKKNCTEKVIGVVEDIKVYTRTTYNDRGRPDGVSTSFPVFKYSYNGTEYSVETNISTGDAGYSKGDQVEILVDPEDPEHIYVPSFKDDTSFAIMMTIVGVAALLICVAVYIKKEQYIKNNFFEYEPWSKEE